MAPRKGKIQGKRNNIKIKSKIGTQKRGLRKGKKTKPGEKPLENLKWINKLTVNKALPSQYQTGPSWLQSATYKHGIEGSAYKHGIASCSSVENSSDYVEYPPQDAEEKSTTSDGSDECNCSQSKYSDANKCGILKHKISSTNSIVAKYIKSGMDHVASFIVESAIRFGEQHGVVIPDKNTPNVYEITCPDGRLDEKCRKIRFKIPKGEAREEDKKALWRAQVKNSMSRRNQAPGKKTDSPPASWKSASDSLEEILPLLEKLKEEGGGVVTSDLDLEKLTRESESDKHSGKEERLKEKLKSMSKRYKSMGDVSKKSSEERKHPSPGPWKRFRQDSLELGRQRLRASTCPRKEQSMSQSPY